MSRRSTKRANAINSEFDSIVSEANKAVSNLVKQVALVKIFTVFMHDNLLNDKGDLSEGDRVDLRDGLVPLYPQIQTALTEITELFNIHDSDNAVWRSNLDSYLADNPSALTEALNRFPKVD